MMDEAQAVRLLTAKLGQAVAFAIQHHGDVPGSITLLALINVSVAAITTIEQAERRRGAGAGIRQWYLDMLDYELRQEERSERVDPNCS